MSIIITIMLMIHDVEDDVEEVRVDENDDDAEEAESSKEAQT